MSMAEGVKKDIDSGATKMWGVSVVGGRGFSITESDPKEIYARVSAYMPYIEFDIQPMLTVDEMIDISKNMQQ